MAAIRSRNGASFALLSQIGSGIFRYGVSTALFAEYSAKMLESVGAKQVTLNEIQMQAILAAIAHFADPVPIYFRLRPNLRDEGDNFVFECAAHYGASYLVTHNVRDFANPQIIGYNVQIITPGAFLKLLKEEPNL